MTFFIRTTVVAVAAIFLLATQSSAADFKRITSSTDFTKMAVDKKLVAGWGWLRAGSDGRVTGVTDGDTVNGTWQWKGPYFCRTITFGTTKRSGCIAVYISEDNIVFILEKGKGQQVPMKIR